MVRTTSLSLLDLVVRVSVGGMFLLGAIVKVQAPGQLAATMEAARIPYPSLAAGVIAWLELLCGIALVAGFGTRVSAALLAATIGTAMATAVLPPLVAASISPWDLLSHAFYTSEWLLLLILIALVLSGPQTLSVDWLFAPFYKSVARRFPITSEVGAPPYATLTAPTAPADCLPVPSCSAER